MLLQPHRLLPGTERAFAKLTIIFKKSISATESQKAKKSGSQP
ncbi:hypothetical protein SAMN04489760_10780 [Syntrophus gentianae]|uniref:Uncharacterized protein n=1 Tax=Syntrophus gentianae TaxID=43775 RepID=A0A1H7WQG4_9BACT|nr:hypothetical protein SAMN04489760_10780 [Syntrophus gentianae]